jgi:arylsulfatase A-like enzyme
MNSGPFRDRRLNSFAVLLLWSALGVTATACKSRPAAPNVVLVSIDSLGAKWLSPPPGEVGPVALAALAQQGVSFTRAYSPASWTLPAHASLFTGLYPDRHGATDERRQLSPDAPTLAETLKRLGYRTVAFTDGGFLHSVFGMARGFDRYDEHDSSGRAVPVPRDGAPHPRTRHATFDRALAYLEAPEVRREPLFLFLHTYALHDFYLPRQAADGDALPCLLGRTECDDAQWGELQDRYRSELARVDVAMGRLVQAIRRLRGPTLLIVLGDHGEGLDPRIGSLHHGGNLDPSLLHVPLLVVGPAVRPLAVTDPVSLVDVFPTIVELVGGKPPTDVDGRSLRGALGGRPLGPRVLLAMEHSFSWTEGGIHMAPEARVEPTLKAVTDGKLWLVTGGNNGEVAYSLDDKDGTPRRIPPDGVPEALRRRLLARGRVAGEGTAQPPLSESVREQLRALGYVQ